MSERPPGNNGGLLASLAILAGTLVTIAHTRLDLASVELQEEVARALSQLLTALAVLLCLGIGVVLATILLILAFWDSHRLLAFGVLAALFLLCGGILWIVAQRKAKAQPKLFAASLSALSTDLQQLGRGNE